MLAIPNPSFSEGRKIATCSSTIPSSTTCLNLRIHTRMSTMFFDVWVIPLRAAGWAITMRNRNSESLHNWASLWMLCTRWLKPPFSLNTSLSSNRFERDFILFSLLAKLKYRAFCRSSVCLFWFFIDWISNVLRKIHRCWAVGSCEGFVVLFVVTNPQQWTVPRTACLRGEASLHTLSTRIWFSFWWMFRSRLGWLGRLLMDFLLGEFRTDCGISTLITCL